jgi:transcriptional regulator with XRE-family HTH domain
MDLKKIGAYIAGKRKGLGLTQRELAEKLGMSDKSVSKWERGVCLPDVSLYTELCGLLGISLNEFFAGEDLDAQSLPQRSEENLISVSADGKTQRKRLKALVAALLCAALLLSLALIWLLTAGARAEKNWIVPFSKDSTERKTAELLAGPEGAYLFQFSTDGSFRSICVYHTLYRHGELASRGALFSVDITEDQFRSGILGLIPDFVSRELKFFISDGNGEVKIGTQLPIREGGMDGQGLMRSTAERAPVRGIEAGREYALLTVSIDSGFLLSCFPEDLEAGNAPPETDEVHCLSLVFSDQAGVK